MNACPFWIDSRCIAGNWCEPVVSVTYKKKKKSGNERALWTFSWLIIQHIIHTESKWSEAHAVYLLEVCKYFCCMLLPGKRNCEFKLMIFYDCCFLKDLRALMLSGFLKKKLGFKALHVGGGFVRNLCQTNRNSHSNTCVTFFKQKSPPKDWLWYLLSCYQVDRQIHHTLGD